MRDLFKQEGQKYNVFPIDNSRSKRLDVSTRPSLMRGRNQITFFQARGALAYWLACFLASSCRCNNRP